MIKFTIVTGNPSKLKELQRLLPDYVEADHHALELDEIQSLDPVEVTADKARRAYGVIKRPVLVEDVSAGLKSLNGLPGTFIKFFNQQLGKDALYKLSNGNPEAHAVCVMVYYDGKNMVVGSGRVEGKVVEMRTDSGFGFDNVLVPDGYDTTMAEMPGDKKDEISHRGKAMRDLMNQLSSLK